MYSPLGKITHQTPSVSCTPPFEKSLFLVGDYFGVGAYFDKYGSFVYESFLNPEKFQDFFSKR